jgi:DNA-binding GntR family transcriptional regulator
LIDRAEDIELTKLGSVFKPFTDYNMIAPDLYRKADEVFHDMIVELSRNPVLKKMSDLNHIHKRVYQFGLVRTPEETLPEHKNISDAIIRRDHKKADFEICNHIDLSRRVLIKQLKAGN